VQAARCQSLARGESFLDIAHPIGRKAAIGLVVAATTYTAVLCFAHTHIVGISNSIVAVVDGAILLTALAFALHRASPWLRILLAALAANFLLLTLFSGDVELKAARDPLVLVVFAALGWRYGSFAAARTTFLAIAAIVISFALFEFLAPGAFAAMFDIIDYYAARGVVNAAAIQNSDSSFFISGMRDGTRMVAPFLGPHRVSSIFLEPVSMGNYGAIAVAFALALDRARWRLALMAGAAGVTAIILADARFGATAAALFVLVRLIPLGWMRAALPVLPLAAIAVLLGFAASDIGYGDDLPTRLAGSGRTLLQMTPAALFGFGATDIVTYDAGYAYAFGAFGLPFCVALWAAFIMLPARTAEAQRYKVFLGVYIAALLCISGTSLFALKSGALAFFLAGALGAPVRAAAAASARGRAHPQGAWA
jgi:putative polymerase